MREQGGIQRRPVRSPLLQVLVHQRHGTLVVISTTLAMSDSNRKFMSSVSLRHYVRRVKQIRTQG